MKRHRQELRPTTEMNVTNLLDTAFILLMAFMVVAPAIKHGLDIELPQVKDAPTIEVDRSISVVLQDRGADGVWILIDAKRVTLEELRERLEARLRAAPEVDVIVEMDQSVTAQAFVEAFAAIKAAGVERIAIEVEPKVDKL